MVETLVTTHIWSRTLQRCGPISNAAKVRLCLKTRSGFERLIFRLMASGSINDTTNIACFAVFVRRKNARPRADDGVFRQSLEYLSVDVAVREFSGFFVVVLMV